MSDGNFRNKLLAPAASTLKIIGASAVSGAMALTLVGCTPKINREYPVPEPIAQESNNFNGFGTQDLYNRYKTLRESEKYDPKEVGQLGLDLLAEKIKAAYAKENDLNPNEIVVYPIVSSNENGNKVKYYITDGGTPLATIDPTNEASDPLIEIATGNFVNLKIGQENGNAERALGDIGTIAGCKIGFTNINLQKTNGNDMGLEIS